MEKVNLMLKNGKSLFVKRKLADELVRRVRGTIVDDTPEPVNASEAVQDEASKLGIDLGSVVGTGKDGKILKRDLKDYQTRMLKAEK